MAAQAQKALGTAGYGGLLAAVGLGKDVAGVGASTKGYGSSTGGYGAAKQAAAKQGRVTGAIAMAPAADSDTGSVRRSARLATAGYGVGEQRESAGDEGKVAAPQGSGTAAATDDSAAKVTTNGSAGKKSDSKAAADPDSEEEDGEILSDEEM